MERIASFTVDHNKLGLGMYISRVDDDIVTYDIRMKKPNGGDYLDFNSLHTIEHLFATYARNSKFKENIIYVGPMGCRTGFYLLTRNLSHKDAIALVADSFNFIANYEGEIPGNTAKECGNYLAHDLKQAKKDAQIVVDFMKDYTEEKLKY